MLGPRSSSNLTVEPHDALDSVAKLISNNKVKWTGYSLPEHVLRYHILMLLIGYRLGNHTVQTQQYCNSRNVAHSTINKCKSDCIYSSVVFGIN